MKPCDRYEELISRLVDGELNREEYDALLAHIGECSRCNALYAAFNAMSDLMRDDEPAPLPEGLHENIMAGVRRSAIEKKNRRMRVVWTRTALTAAACLALVLFASKGFAPDKKAESVALRSQEAAEEILPAAPMNEAALPDEEQEAAAPAVPSASPVPENTPAQTPVPVLEGNPAPLPSPSTTPVSAAGAQSVKPTESPKPTPSPSPSVQPAPAAAAKPTPTPALSPSAAPSPTPAQTPVPVLEGNPAPLPSPSAQPSPAAQSPAASSAAETQSPAREAAAESPVVSAPAEKASAESQAKADAAPAESAAAAKPQTSETPAQSSSAPAEEKRSAAPAAEPEAEAEPPVETPVSNRKGLRALFKMPSLSLMPGAEQSVEDAAADEPQPSPSEEPSPTPSPTPSPEASPAETSPVIIAMEIRSDADYDELMALLDLTEAELPGTAPSRIYQVRYFPEKEGAEAVDLEISIVSEKVYCVRKFADGTEKSYRAACMAGGLKGMMWQLDNKTKESEITEDPLLSTLLGLKPKPSAAPSPKPSASPEPSTGPEPSPSAAPSAQQTEQSGAER